MNFIHRNEGIHRHGLKLTLGHRDLSMSASPGPGEDPYEFPWAVVAPAIEPKECLWWEKPLTPDSQPLFSTYLMCSYIFFRLGKYFPVLEHLKVFHQRRSVLTNRSGLWLHLSLHLLFWYFLRVSSTQWGVWNSIGSGFMVMTIFSQIIFKKLESDIRKELPNHSLSRNLSQDNPTLQSLGFGDRESD